MEIIRDVIYGRLPSIAYFPSFVFDFPDRIYLSPRKAGAKNAFYRRLFQDILDFGGRGHSINEHIIERIHKEDFIAPWEQFFKLFTGGTESDQIDQVIDHAANTVTKVVYEKWNEIFGEETRKRDIVISWNIDEGLKEKNAAGQDIPAERHDLYVQFRVKDGADRFPIETRSLGFRWFFSFLLFTQFRAGRNFSRPLVFLLDEPASNLHASAQQKLIESFPEIAKPPHLLMYSTHSHYMIEPKWLEQAYIVQNEPSAEIESVYEESSLDDASVDVRIVPYRQFVADKGDAISYFQPIADRLRVVPSKFDIEKAGIIVEGKSDYYAIKYFDEAYCDGSLSLYPALGAGTLSALISIQRGWGRKIRVLLDSDEAGQRELERYKSDFLLSDDEVSLLRRFVPGATKIEDVLTEGDRTAIREHLSLERFGKKEFLLVFQEHLASGEKLPLSEETVDKMRHAIAHLKDFL